MLIQELKGGTTEKKTTGWILINYKAWTKRRGHLTYLSSSVMQDYIDELKLETDGVWALMKLVFPTDDEWHLQMQLSAWHNGAKVSMTSYKPN